MNDIKQYYKLISEIEMSEFRLTFNYDNQDKFQEEVEKNKTLKDEIGVLKIKLSDNSSNSDDIRLAFIFVANSLLESFTNIKRFGNFYPDLSQGMIISGYLFGKILEDFKTALKSEGSYHPISDIFMSQNEWNFQPLEVFIENCKNDLLKMDFTSKIIAIDYYEGFKTSILAIVATLREKGLIR